MDRSDLAARIEHTVLGPRTTLEDAKRVLDEALAYGMTACVPPCYAAEAAAYAPNVPLVVPIGFPGGQHATAAKREEAILAWEAGADELGVVANLGLLTGDDPEALVLDVEETVAAVPIPVTAVIETAFLSDEEIHAACEAAVEAGAAGVKTGTGTVQGGVSAETVRLVADYLPVTAAGGIGSWASARSMFEAGAGDIAVENGAAILEGFDATTD